MVLHSTRWLALSYFTYFFSYGIFLPFWSVWLKGIGLTPESIGVLLGAGAVGNLIDRMVQSYVVDFLYFKLIDFPIFNVADCYVTAGAILLAILILFVYKDEELGFLSLKKKHE